MKNKGLSKETVEQFKKLIHYQFGDNSFEVRLFQHIEPFIKYNNCMSDIEDGEEEICLALADAYNN